MKQVVTLTTFAIMMLFLHPSMIAQTSNDPAFDKLLKDLLSFSVPYIDCDELKENTNKYQILDAREEAEYNVSHIEGAMHVGYDKFKAKAVLELDKSTPIVVYCSVGYRSEKIAERLQRMGFTNVKNLYGSIFEWVNRGYPVVDEKGPTKKIHAIDEKWGKWIKKGEKVYWSWNEK